MPILYLVEKTNFSLTIWNSKLIVFKCTVMVPHGTCRTQVLCSQSLCGPASWLDDISIMKQDPPFPGMRRLWSITSGSGQWYHIELDSLAGETIPKWKMGTCYSHKLFEAPWQYSQIKTLFLEGHLFFQWKKMKISLENTSIFWGKFV